MHEKLTLQNISGHGLVHRAVMTTCLVLIRLGGIPMGVISVETRAVEFVIAADPGNPDSDAKVGLLFTCIYCPDVIGQGLICLMSLQYLVPGNHWYSFEFKVECFSDTLFLIFNRPLNLSLFLGRTHSTVHS